MFNTIKKKSQFLQVKHFGKKWVTDNFILQAFRETDATLVSSSSQLGFIVTRKIGNAVKRNYAKRRLREICRLKKEYFQPVGIKYILIARYPIIRESFAKLLRDLQWALERIHQVLAGLSVS